MSAFPLWKTIKIGTHDAEGLIAATQASGAFVPDDVADTLRRDAASFSTQETEIDLVLATWMLLRLPPIKRSKKPYADVCKASAEHGLTLCSSEIALQLLLQYDDLPRGKVFPFAMTPFETAGRSAIFVIAHPRGHPRCLGLVKSVEHYKPNPIERFILVQPRWAM